MKKRIFGLILTLVMLLSFFCACADDIIKSTDEELKVVGNCGDYEVTYQELRYLTMTYKALLSQKYGDDIFSSVSSEYIGEYINELETAVVKQLTEDYASLAEFEANGIALDDSVTEDYVDAMVEELKLRYGGIEGYAAYIKECYMTDELVRSKYAFEHCFDRYYDIIAKEYDREAYDAVLGKEGFVRVRSIFIRNDKGEKIETNRANAERVRNEIAAGASIEDYIGTRYNQDPSNCDYYFMEDYFERIYGISLEIGEVSPVIEIDDCFYIIQRVEFDEAYFELNIESCKQKYIVDKIYKFIDERASKMKFEFNEYGKSIDLWTME